ncbi:hypothetical protein A2U01_0105324, partial [Trifolium medium]|nr:hypothetical protein [Trifolium medium]
MATWKQTRLYSTGLSLSEAFVAKQA